MKTLHLIPALAWMATSALAQSSDIDKYFMLKMRDIKTKTPQIMEYDVIIKRLGSDPINGAKVFGDAVKATYYVLNNDSVKWNHLRLAQIDDLRQTRFEGTELPAFNGLSYKTKGTDFLKDDFYKNIPEGIQKDWATMLVTDAVMMQEIVWYIADSLEYKKEYFLKLMENQDITVENMFTFTSSYQKYIWSGITKHNEKICAIVKFESFSNPFTNGWAKGRSMYYGEWWISLNEKQVEYSIMVEDVILQPFSSKEKLVDLQREIVFNRVK